MTTEKTSKFITILFIIYLKYSFFATKKRTTLIYKHKTKKKEEASNKNLDNIINDNVDIYIYLQKCLFTILHLL